MRSFRCTSRGYMISPIEEIIKDLQAGKCIVLVDNENRENEGDFVFAAQYATYENVKIMVNTARGLLCVPITQDIADNLGLTPMVQNNTDKHKTAFTISVDADENVTTGISINDRLNTILALANKKTTPQNLRRPGHVFPLIAKHGGVLERAGHTEGSLDLLKIAGLTPVAAICEILNEDGTMARLEKDIVPLAEEMGVKIISIQAIKEYRQRTESFYTESAVATLPTKYGVFDIHVFVDPFDSKEHIALSMGNISGKKNILARLHSSCITGDIFNSIKCDCGDQLDNAMKMIATKGEGLILYLNQEGRGIGLVNKIKAYQLQEKGLDTVESNEALGFAPDLRDYTPAAQMLKALSIQSIQLITNNPQKINDLTRLGIVVTERIPSTVIDEKPREHYLETKKNKMGHLI